MPRTTRTSSRSRATKKRRSPKRPDGPTPVTAEQFEILDRLANGEAHLRAFLAFIFQRQTGLHFGSSEVTCSPGRYVEIHHQTIARLFPKADWKPLSDLEGKNRAVVGLSLGAQREEDVTPGATIGTRDYWAQGKRARRFKLSSIVVNKLRTAAPRTVAESASTVWRNVWNGRQAHVPLRSVIGTSPRPAPAMLRGALDSLRFGLFDHESLEEHLRRSLRASSGRELDARARMRLRARYAVDFACYNAVLRQRPEPWEGYARYLLAYTVNDSGRIQQRGGGLQNASKEMKAAAYARIPGLHNWDIKRSHLAGFCHFTREAGLSTSAVETLYYGGAEQLEAAAGLVPGAFKRLLYPLLSGGKLPDLGTSMLQDIAETHEQASIRQRVRMGDLARRRYGNARSAAKPKTVQTVLRECLTGDDGYPLVAFPKRYAAVREGLADAIAEIEQWHHYLAGYYVPQNLTHGRGGRFIRNTLGMQQALGKRSGGALTPHRVAKWVVPHLLQGLEAAFIHALTVSLYRRDVSVVSNEHDGVVVYGDVWQSDIDYARAFSGFASANLVEKPFDAPA